MLATTALLFTAALNGAVPTASQDPAHDVLEALVGDAVLASSAERGMDVQFDGVTGSMAGCAPQRASLGAPIQRSGRVSVRVDGARPDGGACAAFVAAHVRVFDELVVATTAIAPGDAIDGRVRFERVERTGAARGLGRAELPAGARAARALPAGTALRSSDLTRGPAPGTSVIVVARAGSVRVEQPAQVAACPSQPGSSPALVCATLKSGKRVSGFLDADGTLLVQMMRAPAYAEVR